ncbi:DNA mismatch repair endonuclease MutL [Lachnospiraceae bacterium MD1]|uniref:DNA mismatch repair protein MutL n=1 Tax=Variimorphobacter saccharofermentans TaxID=2755051 RepID=A0A839K2S4_9FIRM|nr:DNA mismatch repair endonuclease MutL [Variimorphobacter saccharofermentans]MBB2182991.1 DNA mismatch repair endonuclease MutL [Variimorphobacter saccharofermentans]
MSIIHILDEPTINQIAAGEVVERPSAVVKELIENAMDAGATAITAELKDGGLSFIRITDNGAGIPKEDIPLAFLRHATSKIRSAEDLLSITSLGFRGEALSSISAVAQVELITKTPSSLNGYRYLIEGGEEKSLEEIGCPGGTTIIVRNLFYNTPARRKFLKSATTEAGYVSDLMERLMISHPNISFKFILNNQVKLQSSGNNSSRDILYHIYGRDISKELISLEYQSENISISGYIGKPVINRGNRNFENYFINGRYIKSNVITKAIEEAYKPFLMQHKYPFTSIYFEINPSLIDVNVHPQKLEIRLKNSEEVYQTTFHVIRDALSNKEMIPKVKLTAEEEKKEELVRLPEPFEENRRKQFTSSLHGENNVNTISYSSDPKEKTSTQNYVAEQCSYPTSKVLNTSIPAKADTLDEKALNMHRNDESVSNRVPEVLSTTQMNLFEEAETETSVPFLSKQALQEHRIIGQVFQTYWLIEYQKELYIIDQHAAHEKVLYERIMTAARNKTFASQQLLPPIVLTLSLREQEVIKKHEEVLASLGYEIEQFGGNEYSVRAVPADLYGISEKELLLEFIDELAEDFIGKVTDPNSVLERVASLSCKAAVKANHSFTSEEAATLINELLTLENPYHCPHGRPVIISMSQYEMERKFKRIV